MMLLTKENRRQLQENALRQKDVAGTPEEIDFKPVVKLFMPDGGATWLLSELDPEDGNTAFGLCDLGQGCPELGSVWISEIESIRGAIGLPVERDRNFRASKTLMEYAEEARKRGRIAA